MKATEVVRHIAPQAGTGKTLAAKGLDSKTTVETMGDPIMVQSQLDVENAGIDDASAPLLQPIVLTEPSAGSETNNCCMIACCAPLAIKNGGGDDPEPTPTVSSPVVAHHKGWANLFKLNVVLTVAAAMWFGGLAIEALKNDSLSGEGRRRLMHQHHGEHSHHHGGRSHHFDPSSSSSFDSSE